jgi:hypothetical protein
MNRMNRAQIETKNTLPQSIRIQSVGLLNRNPGWISDQDPILLL